MNDDRNYNEKTVRDEYMLYHGSFMQSPTAQLIVNPLNLEIIEANYSAARFYDLPVKSLKKMKITGLLAVPEENIQEKMQSAIANHSEIWTFKQTLPHGEHKEIEFHVFLIEINDKYFFNFSINDVTLKNRSTIQLMQNFQKYYDVFENASELILLINSDGSYNFSVEALNPAAQSCFSLTEVDAAAGPLEQFVHRENAALWIENAEKCRTHSKSVSFEFAAGPAWYNVIFTPLRDSNGITNKILASCRDVSAYKRNVEHLKKSEMRFKTLVESANVLIWETDKTLKYTYVSPQVKSILGFETREMMNLEIIYFMKPGSREKVKEMLNPSKLNSNSYVTLEIEHIHKNGETVMMEFYSYPLFDENKAVTGYCGILRDVTESRKAAENLKAAKDEAVTARNAADLANAAKSRFLANMSHEIRTPLNSVLGFSDLLAETPLFKDQSEYLNYIRSSGRLLLSLINDILDFSKIESGMLQLEKINFDITEIITEVLKTSGTASSKKGVNLASDIDDITCQLIGDPYRLRQVLTNLVTNAIKFTENGNVVTRVIKQNETEKTITIKISVIDEGIGMNEEIRQRLFKPFMQADTSTTRVYGGTGLGLAICNSLVKLMGGEQIFVDSAAGCGSNFYFTLEFEKYFETAEHTFIESTADMESVSGFNILLVEDNVLNSKLASRILELNGNKVTSVGTGLAALNSLQNNSYDLILMDIRLPVMDGYSATREIRKLNRQIPIIAMTAGVIKGDYEECIASGMNDYISKPISIKELKYKLHKILKVDKP